MSGALSTVVIESLWLLCASKSKLVTFVVSRGKKSKGQVSCIDMLYLCCFFSQAMEMHVFCAWFLLTMGIYMRQLMFVCSV